MTSKPKKDPAAMFAGLGETDTPPETIVERSPQPLQPPQPEPPTKKRGRPAGKRSDPNFTQIGAYIPVELYKQVMKRVSAAKYDDSKAPDLSEVIATLLDKWLSDESSK